MNSPDNRALLARKFGKRLPERGDTKVSLTIDALLSIVEAAREEERRDARLRAIRDEQSRQPPMADVFSDLFGKGHGKRGPFG